MSETEMEIYPFRLVKCDRRPKETKAVALRPIKQGEVILDRPWIARASFIVSNEKEKEETLKGCMDKPDISPTFTLAESQAIGGGTPMSHMFAHLNTPAHLQLTCCLIQQHSFAATQWVENNVFSRRTCKGVASMDTERHKLAIQWLRLQNVPTQSLLYWANRANFTALYEMMVGCAMSLDFVMSGTVTGLVFCPILSTFNHSCVPNMVCKMLPNSYVLVACDDIKAGQELTFSYSTQAIGLADINSVKEFYLNRFGFECDCDYHRGKVSLYHERATPPRSIGVIRHKNKLAAFILDKLEECCKKEDWDEMKRIGRFAWIKFQDLLSTEPCFIFEFCSRYAGCVQHGEPDSVGHLLLILFEQAMERYCHNPVYMLKVYFATLLETLRKWTIKIHNGKTTETVMTGMDGEDQNTFLNRWIEIRKYSRLLFLSDSDLMFLEGHMFTGLQDYLHAMESTVRQVEIFVRKDNSKSTGDWAKSKDNLCISLSSNMTMMFLTSFGNKTTIQKISYTEYEPKTKTVPLDEGVKKQLAVKVYVAESPKPKKKRTRRHKTKRDKTSSETKVDNDKNAKITSLSDEKQGNQVEAQMEADHEDDLFIPIQISWDDDDEDEEFFIPQQYDFSFPQEVMV